MNQDPILLKLITDTGLQNKEAKVYLALLERGQASVGDISKLSGLKRPIIYVLLEDLIKRGYATELPNKKIRIFQATDPTAISAQLQTNSKNFSQMLPILKTLANSRGNRPKISYFDTKEGILKVFDQTNRAKNAFFLTSISRLEDYFTGSISAWQKGYANGSIKLQSRNLIPNNQEDIEIYRQFVKITDKVQFRILPNVTTCDMDLCVFDNTMTLTTFEDKPFMVTIETNAVPNFFIPIFDMLWNSAAEAKEE